MDGPASDMSISSQAASFCNNPVMGWSGVVVRYSTALRGLGGALSIRWASVGPLSYKTSSGGENDHTFTLSVTYTYDGV